MAVAAYYYPEKSYDDLKQMFDDKAASDNIVKNYRYAHDISRFFISERVKDLWINQDPDINNICQGLHQNTITILSDHNIAYFPDRDSRKYDISEKYEIISDFTNKLVKIAHDNIDLPDNQNNIYILSSLLTYSCLGLNKLMDNYKLDLFDKDTNIIDFLEDKIEVMGNVAWMAEGRSGDEQKVKNFTQAKDNILDIIDKAKELVDRHESLKHPATMSFDLGNKAMAEIIKEILLNSSFDIERKVASKVNLVLS